MAFLDVRDHTGLVQCVVEATDAARPETVVRITGAVRLRPAGTANPALPTGEVELFDCSVEVLGDAAPAPFALDGRSEVDETVRLRYRYLDLRGAAMQSNLRLRAVVLSAIRRSMEEQGFLEVETPLLWTPTPEGAREFAIPSRLQRGAFYVLPQSPQIAKQLAMVGGLDRYYQIARCLRDEDLRADRQFEFPTLDLGTALGTESDMRAFTTRAVMSATNAVTGETPPEVVTMTWDEALERYGTDKPDLRFGMELCDLTRCLANTELGAFHAPAVRGIVLGGGAALGRARLDALVERAKALGAKGLVWMRVVPGERGNGERGNGEHGNGERGNGEHGNGERGGKSESGGSLELESPVAKFLSPAERAGILAASGAGLGDLVLVVAGEHRLSCEVLGQLRVELGRPAAGEGPLRFCWVVDFPLFDGVDGDGNLMAAHHPFTMPKSEDLALLSSDPLAVRAQSYDLVLNGWELGSGSIRIHRADIQAAVFAALGIGAGQARERFGFLLGAFSYGAPPHGGFAVGLDRLVAILAGEENIREVIAFPKTQSGADLMTGAPKALGARQLAELGIAVVVPGAGAPPGR